MLDGRKKTQNRFATCWKRGTRRKRGLLHVGIEQHVAKGICDMLQGGKKTQKGFATCWNRETRCKSDLLHVGIEQHVAKGLCDMLESGSKTQKRFATCWTPAVPPSPGIVTFKSIRS